MDKVLWCFGILAVIGFVYFVFKDNINPVEKTLIKKNLKRGKERTIIHKGKITNNTDTLEYEENYSIKKKSVENSFVTSDSTEDYDLHVKITPSIDTNKINMKYFLNLHTKQFMRVDTLLRYRIDTLHLTRTKILKNPFYNTFWFGAAITSLIIILVSTFAR